ncbi:hypothetical protein VSH64_09465 [Amycolatopsis rhabdoformis]|uniref:SPOR domain-containing protein n=1 Tax=Amycolatopsis rhabdoformis TaxID=1448059 RepID=A0ABZ1ID24_9PSEU|nr:hypothetical protein [Amycolatopsis rhabdoformis]WSE32330.1 hypothetical protein VSH64_09465 [Amycolatopsis rhabdoformis]
MPENRKIWEIQLAVYATEQQAEELKRQVSRLLCPDPNHAPPCPVPWSVSLVEVPGAEEREPYASLLTQAEIEGQLRS